MATKWPCDQAIVCGCNDNPLGNFSSENPDPFTFFARRFFPNPTRLDDPPGVFVAPSCGAACTSAVSQADADACALREATLCVQPPDPPGLDDPTLFGNRALSCETSCPEGPPFVISVAAGTYLARTQELADAIARSFCQDNIIELRHCDMPGPAPGPGPQPDAPCPIITGTSTTPVNLNVGDSTTLSVSYTYASANMLMFVWFLNGVATYATMDATLQLTSVDTNDSGEYVLGIYASGCFPVFSSGIQVNVGCVAEVGPPNAPADTGDGTFDYAARVSIGTFEVLNTGDNHDPGVGQNSTSIGPLAAGWYDVVYQGGGIEFTAPDTNPPFDPVTAYTADAWGAEFEISGVPIAIVDYPYDSSLYATCALAEATIAAPGTSLTGPFQTTASGGGAARVYGGAWPTVPPIGSTMAKCTSGSWPTLEVFNYVFEPMPLDIQITDFANFAAALSMCVTCQDRLGVEWDGTLQRVAYDPFFLTYQIPAPFSSATVSLNGKRISTSSVEIILTEDPPGTPAWKLTIKCKNIGQPNGGGTGQIIWSGIKAAGRTPVGTYISKEEACNPGKNPECCQIVQI